MSPKSRSAAPHNPLRVELRSDGGSGSALTPPAADPQGSSRRDSPRRWSLSVESSPAALAEAAELFWSLLTTGRGDAKDPPPELARTCVDAAADLRPFESDSFRLAAQSGLAIDVSIYRGPEHWVLMRRSSQVHAQGLGRLAFVYSALARSRDAVVYTDAAGTLLGASERWLALYGFSHLDVLGENPRVINSRQHPRSFFRELFVQLVDPAIGTWSGEIFNRGKSGDLIQVSQTITTFPDVTGAVSGYLGITRDITAHRDLRERLMKSNDELAARLKAEDELLSMTVHDLRSPLHAVLGFIELASGDVEQHAVVRASSRLERAREAGERLEMLIQTLLDAQRARSGRLELSPSRVWVTSILRSEVELHRVHAARRGIAIELRQAGSALPGFFDELRLGEAFSNLLGNAVKFSPVGATITVELTSTELGDYEIVVDDQGPGIPAAERDSVFELYYQSHANQQRALERQGSGWGLYIAKRVIELHGGSLMTEEAPGGGCRMRLRFRSLPGVWERRPWAAAVLDPAERIWSDLSAQLRARDLPSLAAHSVADLELLVARELPNLVFAPVGALDLLALAAIARSTNGAGAEPAIFLVARAAAGLEVSEASGPASLVAAVRSWFERQDAAPSPTGNLS